MRLFIAALLLTAHLAHATDADASKPAHAGSYAVLNQYTLGGAGSWDYLTLNPVAHQLFISRSDRVLVVNTDDGSVKTTISGTNGVHGIALIPQLGRGYTTNGRTDTLTVFDMATLKSTGTIPTGGHNPDALIYDEASKHLFVFNGRSNDASIIDPVSGKLLMVLPLAGRPEFAAVDGKGRLFLNIEDKAKLVGIDTIRSKVVATWSLATCEEPSGLAFDVAHERLFSTCQNGVMIVTDSTSGKQVARIPIGKGPDAAAFDEAKGLVFSSNGDDGTLTVVHEDDADHYSVVSTVPTQKSARTMALDAKTHRIYLVAAEFGKTPSPSKEQPHPRPLVLDNSFKVLVVGE